MDTRYELCFGRIQTLETRRRNNSCISPFQTKEEDSKDPIKKIYAREEKICKFQNNDYKAIANIGKMCTDIVQNKFLSIKVLKE